LFLDARYQFLSLTIFVVLGTFLLLFHAASLPIARDIMRPARTENCAFLNSGHGSSRLDSSDSGITDSRLSCGAAGALKEM
jgi:hypothetical protein